MKKKILFVILVALVILTPLSSAKAASKAAKAYAKVLIEDLMRNDWDSFNENDSSTYDSVYIGDKKIKGFKLADLNGDKVKDLVVESYLMDCYAGGEYILETVFDVFTYQNGKLTQIGENITEWYPDKQVYCTRYEHRYSDAWELTISYHKLGENTALASHSQGYIREYMEYEEYEDFYVGDKITSAKEFNKFVSGLGKEQNISKSLVKLTEKNIKKKCGTTGLAVSLKEKAKIEQMLHDMMYYVPSNMKKNSMIYTVVESLSVTGGISFVSAYNDLEGLESYWIHEISADAFTKRAKDLFGKSLKISSIADEVAEKDFPDNIQGKTIFRVKDKAYIAYYDYCGGYYIAISDQTLKQNKDGSIEWTITWEEHNYEVVEPAGKTILTLKRDKKSAYGFVITGAKFKSN